MNTQTNMTIYDLYPEFKWCFTFKGDLYFCGDDALEKLEEMKIKVWRRKNAD